MKVIREKNLMPVTKKDKLHLNASALSDLKSSVLLLLTYSTYYMEQGGVTLVTPVLWSAKCLDYKIILLHSIGITILGFSSEISLDLDQFYQKYQRDIVTWPLTMVNISIWPLTFVLTMVADPA